MNSIIFLPGPGFLSIEHWKSWFTIIEWQNKTKCESPSLWPPRISRSLRREISIIYEILTIAGHMNLLRANGFKAHSLLIWCTQQHRVGCLSLRDILPVKLSRKIWLPRCCNLYLVILSDWIQYANWLDYLEKFFHGNAVFGDFFFQSSLVVLQIFFTFLIRHGNIYKTLDILPNMSFVIFWKAQKMFLDHSSNLPSIVNSN